MRMIERLTSAVRAAARYNSDVQVAPMCILWCDKERQWEAIIPRLQPEVPELLVLGEHAPEQHKGPAIWLRCAIAGATTEVTLPPDRPPILYLPGVGRQDLRAVESCPGHVIPLAELQYRGCFWSQASTKDWTALAFLKSEQGGLGLDVAADSETKQALLLALDRLLYRDLTLLEGKHLDKEFFNTLSLGEDPVRNLLQWLDQGEQFQNSLSANEFHAFVQVCKSKFAFQPNKEGLLGGASRLAQRSGQWAAVWVRYSEAPTLYKNIPGRIRSCQAPSFDFLLGAEEHGGWPQWNEQQEIDLERSLLSLAQATPSAARAELLNLEKRHGQRRQLVWAALGEAPLARALEHLALVAEVTKTTCAAGNPDDIKAAYVNQGWRADDAALSALAAVDKQKDLEAVAIAVRAVYLPWLDEAALYLQQQVQKAGYPGGTKGTSKPSTSPEGECVLFVDGLRFDAAKRLAARLEKAGHSVAERAAWSALPSVTATGKAAVSPIVMLVDGAEDCNDFEPRVTATGQPLSKHHLHKLIRELGWEILDGSSLDEKRGRAWCEFGDIDHEGHALGAKLARTLDGLLGEIEERVTGLLHDGWTSVRVVTDHGWLLMPGGLPKIDMFSGLAENKWGRCASVKPGAITNEKLYPWYWNDQVQFALASGVRCYKQSVEYTHGGLSLQECLTLELRVSGGAGRMRPKAEITDIKWRGLRCSIAVEGGATGLSADIRTEPGNAKSSVVMAVKPLSEAGAASLVVEDEDRSGSAACLVLLDARGELVAEMKLTIGGEG